MKPYLIFFIALFLYSSQSFSDGELEKDVIDIENHPQTSFPKIVVTIGDQSVDYYSSSSSAKKSLFFINEKHQLKGEVPLSGYIFAKEFVESFKFLKTVANKKSKEQFVKIFSENNPGKLIEFLMEVNERKRTAETKKEYEELAKLIKKAKSDDDLGATAIFSTGYIEIKPLPENNERHFFKMSDVTKKNMKLSPDKTKIELLKSISIYSFQNILSSLSFGDIEKDGAQDQLYQKLERVNLSICSTNCNNIPGKDLGEFAMNVGKIVTFEVVGNNKIPNMEDFNNYVLAQQWCAIKNFAEACNSETFKANINKLSEDKILQDLLIKHKSSIDLCNFVKK